MFDFFIQIFNNKLLFYGVIVVIGFIIFSIILIKKSSKEDKIDKIDVEKIDGDHSLFDEALKSDSDMKTSDGKLDLESMIEKMQKDLDAKASDVIEKFENEQEEKSVISYQELIENKEAPSSEIKQENKKISLNEVLDKMDGKNPIENDDNLDTTYVNALKLEEKNLIDSREVDEELNDLLTSNLNKKEEYVKTIKNGDDKESGKFKATEFISPIYGVQNIKVQYPTVQNMKEFRENAANYNKFELEQTLNMEPLNDEIRKNEDFLKALKEFRKNLE